MIHNHLRENKHDLYADSIITEASGCYISGNNSLGPPDGVYTQLYSGYTSGHITLDMGSGEEIIDGDEVDFTVYADGGEYAIYVGNNYSYSILLQKPGLVFVGSGKGNTSFDLDTSGLEKARYVHVVYISGQVVQLDAIEVVNVAESEY